MRSRSSVARAALVCAALALGLVALALLPGCGQSGQATSSDSSPSAEAVASPSSSSAASPVSASRLMKSATSVAGLRSQLKAAFAEDPVALCGTDFRATPASAMAALERYFASVDPATFNEASRAVFVWAYTTTREPDGHRSTSTRQYVVAYFFADGDEMVAAGSIAPGYNEHLMRLSRSSPSEAWHVDGLYYP